MDIKTKRKAGNLTQVELAQILGVSQEAVSRWESGSATPQVAKLPALAKALGCTIGELFEAAAPPEESAIQT